MSLPEPDAKPGELDAASEEAASEFLSEASDEFQELRRTQRSAPGSPSPVPTPLAAPPANLRVQPLGGEQAVPPPPSPTVDEAADRSGPNVPRAIGTSAVDVPRVIPLPTLARQVQAASGTQAAGERWTPVAGRPFGVVRPRMPDAPIAPVPPAAVPAEAPRRSVPWGWLVFTVAAAVGVTAWPLLRSRSSSPDDATAVTPSASIGTATISSRPEGADVWINGERRGVTPLTTTLPVGTHRVDVRLGEASRTLALEMTPNGSVRESLDLVPAAAAGAASVSTSVPAPPVAATRTPPVVLPVLPPGSTGGFLTVRVPFEMQIRENGRIVGTTSADQVMLPAGARQLDLISDVFEFQTTISASIEPGQTTTVTVSVPQGRLSINAVPWAEVWLDGAPLGATPLGNVEVPVGPHELVWRHPSLGERRQVVRVGARTPARVSVNLSAAAAPAP